MLPDIIFKIHENISNKINISISFDDHLYFAQINKECLEETEKAENNIEIIDQTNKDSE